jgi:ADP-ribose pyrophosphatase YjhB (NUDIX family)
MPLKTDISPQLEHPDPYRFCPHCGTGLDAFHDHDRLRKRCPRCGWIRYRNPTVGIALLIIQDGKVLLGQRRDQRWCIPCGHVEWDEDIHSAARREAFEELGVQVSIGEIFAVHSNFHDPVQHTVGIWFEAQIGRGAEPVAGGDLQSIAYFKLEDIPDLAFPTDQLVLQKLKRINP